MKKLYEPTVLPHNPLYTTLIHDCHHYFAIVYVFLSSSINWYSKTGYVSYSSQYPQCFVYKRQWFFFFKLKICQHLMFKGSIVEGCPNRWLYFFCETRASLVEIEEHKEPLINLVNCYNCILDSITSPWARDTLWRKVLFLKPFLNSW